MADDWQLDVEVRPLGRGEEALQEALRLAAMEEAPDAFGEPLDKVSNHPDNYWQRLRESVTGRAGQMSMLACADSRPIGFIYGVRSKDYGELRLGGVWVESRYRQRGVGRQLVQALIEWAESKGFPSIGLWAPEHRPEVVALYRSLGFETAGATRPLPGDESRQLLEMRRDGERPA